MSLLFVISYPFNLFIKFFWTKIPSFSSSSSWSLSSCSSSVLLAADSSLSLTVLSTRATPTFARASVLNL